MITPRVERFAIVMSIVLVLIVLDMVRRRKLRERYSLIWLFAVAAMTMLVVWEKLLLSITSLIGATDPSSTLFLFGILFALAILLHLSNKVSDFSTQLRILAKEVAMLNVQLSEVRCARSRREEETRDEEPGLELDRNKATEEGRR
jgi:hypothetical protein